MYTFHPGIPYASISQVLAFFPFPNTTFVMLHIAELVDKKLFPPARLSKASFLKKHSKELRKDSVNLKQVKFQCIWVLGLLVAWGNGFFIVSG